MRGVDVRGLGAILQPEMTHVGSYIVDQSGIESSKSLNKLEKLERSKQQAVNPRMVNSLVGSERASSDVNRR